MKIRSPLLNRCLGWLIIVALRALFRTVRLEFVSEDPRYDPAATDAPVSLFSLWHDAIAIPILIRDRYRNEHSVCALVSRHQDGSVLVDALRHTRIEAVRGSTSRGGVRAVRELLQRVRQSHVFITPDGPRGPRRQLKDGILFLASQSGRPIVPVASTARPAWVFRGNWTDLLIPRPFSRAVCVLGRPMIVPPDVSRAELDSYRHRLQAEMERLHDVAERIASGVEPQDAIRRAA